METINISNLYLGVSLGQGIVVIFVLVLNIYFDDYRELSRKYFSHEEKIFDWVWNRRVLIPMFFGVLFVLGAFWATEKIHDLKEKVHHAEEQYASEKVAEETAFQQNQK
jgi:H+/Cl- antiporter ClcA